jgi:hypothetical protein
MKNPIRNLIVIAASAPASVAAARAAALELAHAKDPAGAGEDAAGRIVFAVEWEPAFKDLKALSARFPEVGFTLYGDSFAKQHWITKTVFAAGKAESDGTFSRIDGDDFRRVFQEIFGEEFREKR